MTFSLLDSFKRIFYFCSLVALYAFAWLVFVLFMLLVLLVRAKSFRKKNNKGFKMSLITSFIIIDKFAIVHNYYILHNLIYITIIASMNFLIITIFFNHYNLFQLLQSFSIITILFNYHDLFQLSQFFSIITIFQFDYHDPFQLS